MANGNGLSSVQHMVVLMLENRSSDHMLGYLYASAGQHDDANALARAGTNAGYATYIQRRSVTHR